MKTDVTQLETLMTAECSRKINFLDLDLLRLALSNNIKKCKTKYCRADFEALNLKCR